MSQLNTKIDVTLKRHSRFIIFTKIKKKKFQILGLHKKTIASKKYFTFKIRHVPKILTSFSNLQYFAAVIVFVALAQATPIEYGHYAAPALVHAPVYHAPIAKHVVHAEPIVN